MGSGSLALDSWIDVGYLRVKTLLIIPLVQWLHQLSVPLIASRIHHSLLVGRHVSAGTTHVLLVINTVINDYYKILLLKTIQI